MASLTIETVWKASGDYIALRDVNLDIKDGEFVVLVGLSGCGKSTLLSIIAGGEDTSHGALHLGARDVTDLSPKDRNSALVFQSYALYPTMSVRQNISFGMENCGVPRADQDRVVADVAALLQIEPLLGRKPAQLSGGQRQRVTLGLRPEHFRPAEADLDKADQGVAVTATVEVVEPTGPDTMLVLTLAGQPVTAVNPAGFRPVEVSAVRLCVDMGHVCFLDTDTDTDRGARIAQADAADDHNIKARLSA